MDVYSSPRILTTTSLLSPIFNFPSLNNTDSRRFYKTQFSKSFPLSTRLIFSKTNNFQISAHFRRTPNRRNSLGKKLLGDQNVQPSNRRNSLWKKLVDDQNVSISTDPNRISDGNDNNVNEGTVGTGSLEESESSSNVSSNPALVSKLESWVNQYKKDVEIWGIGSGPIFTIYQDSDGKIRTVVVNEDEILRRNDEFSDSTKVNLKISRAKHLANEIENGISVIPQNSSVAKFIVADEQTDSLSVTQGLPVRHVFSSKFSKIAMVVFFGVFVLWTVKSRLSIGKHDEELTMSQKEMLRRKIASRMEREEREKKEKETIEIVEDHLTKGVFTNRPKIDKQEVINAILNARSSIDTLALPDSSSSLNTQTENIDDKIKEIREMAWKAREIEDENLSLPDRDDDEEEENVSLDGKVFNESEVFNLQEEEGKKLSSLNLEHNSKYTGEDTKDDNNVFLGETATMKTEDMVVISSIPSLEILDERQTELPELIDGRSTMNLLDKIELKQQFVSPLRQPPLFDQCSSKKKPRIIRSVAEAREFLSSKRDKQAPAQEGQDGCVSDDAKILDPQIDFISKRSKSLELGDDEMFKPHTLDGTPFIVPEVKGFEDSTTMKEQSFEAKHTDLKNVSESSDQKENWLEKNFHELEPVVNKIGIGFRKNYAVAKEKVNLELNLCSDMNKLGMNEDDGELDWMKDDHLREIVFQVRENELAGKDPFFMMDTQDKAEFFEGLEKKAEKVNQELGNLHEWVHSNIENLDYGADGISIYDSPEKIIPRWKGPPLEKSPEFLHQFMEQRKTLLAENTNVPFPVNDDADEDEDVSLEKSKESTTHENLPTSSRVYDPINRLTKGNSKKAKVVIEGSDGSVKTGSKTGKEYWQHTKKWSRGFIDSYSAETDPEIKSVMKDMGKDLDRWITEKEIKEAAELMTKLPEKNKQFMEKKLEKLKREMELFGPQAVVNKYREYGEEKKEDYLWWLDLPFVLCIELYTNQNEERRIGLYSLEMAEDLELDPKQYHVIAFEDAGDCKNFCYIIQAHLEMLGNGNAFVVARPPKDAFREAKANGFSVTVIRKGELKLNIDQTLEEVEENISDIGSKIYHDKIMQERSVDIGSLMKGVFGAGKLRKRRSKKRRIRNKSNKHLKNTS